MTRTPRTQTQQRWAQFGFGGQKRYAATTPDEASFLNHLFAPDTVVPEQLLTDRHLSPEQRLQFAVLQDAVDLIRKPGSVKPIASHTAKQEALDWMLSEESVGPFAFQSICEHLGLAPSRFRVWAREEMAGLQRTERRKRSRYIGVHHDNRTNRWIARIGKSPRQHLGTFATQEEAARKYDSIAVKHYRGWKKRLNFPEEYKEQKVREMA